jgi:hypothetical protein
MALGFVGRLGITPDHPAMKAAANGDHSLLKAHLASLGDKAKGWEQYVALAEKSHADGKTVAEQKAAATAQLVHDAAGGVEAWTEIQTWAKANAEPNERAEVNAALKAGGMQAQAMVAYLKGLYEGASGTTVKPAEAVVPAAKPNANGPGPSPDRRAVRAWKSRPSAASWGYSFNESPAVRRPPVPPARRPAQGHLIGRASALPIRYPYSTRPGSVTYWWDCTGGSHHQISEANLALNTYTPTRPAQANGAGSTLALVIEEFTGLVQGTLDRMSVCAPRIPVRPVKGTATITNFGVGQSTIQAIVPGTQPDGSVSKFGKASMTIDTTILARAILPLLETFQTDYDARALIAEEHGRLLARQFDQTFFIQATKAGQLTANRFGLTAAGHNGGSQVTLSQVSDAPIRRCCTRASSIC